MLILILYGINVVINIVLGLITGNKLYTITGVLWLIAGEIRISRNKLDE